MKYQSFCIGDLEIPIDTVREIDIHNHSHITIYAGSNAEYNLHKDNYLYTDWDAFIKHLDKVFVL